MKFCAQCQQQNQDDANFCYQCGTNLVAETEQPAIGSIPPPTPTESDLWRIFIGPNADRYLELFKKFGPDRSPKFALTWNWPAFLFIPFLWFLYRKMYLYAAVYAIGPMASAYLTSDISSGIVWSVVAGATSNYVYYWHCREQIGAIKQRAWNDPDRQKEVIKEAGGVQPYVIWVGVALYVIFSMTMFKMIQEGPPDGDRFPTRSARPVPSIRM